MSALRGDNIIEPQPQHALVPRADAASATSRPVESTTTWPTAPFRMPVQWVNRPNLDFRGFSGRIVGGTVRPGDRVRVLPSGTTSTVARIVTFDGDLDEAVAGQSVTLTLADEIDVSRGDVLVRGRRARRGGRPVRGPRRVDARATRCSPAGRT